MPDFTEPSDRKHQGSFSFASCEDESQYAWGEQFGKGKLEDVPFDGIVPYFTKHAHPNIPLAVAHIMQNHGVKVMVNKIVLEEDDSFWTTGNESPENYGQIRLVSEGVLLMPIGHLEQMLCAALATLYKYGTKTRDGGKKMPHLSVYNYHAPDDIIVHFKFEGQDVVLQIMSNSPAGGRTIHLAAGSA